MSHTDPFAFPEVWTVRLATMLSASFSDTPWLKLTKRSEHTMRLGTELVGLDLIRSWVVRGWVVRVRKHDREGLALTDEGRQALETI